MVDVPRSRTEYVEPTAERVAARRRFGEDQRDWLREAKSSGALA